MTDSSRYGTSLFTSPGERISAGMPHDLAWEHRRRSSIIRSGVRATSMPPLWVNTPSSWYCSVLSVVRSNIIFEYSMGKMKLEAWPVEPPGFGSGPLSSRTRSRQPSSARWWTRLLPTIPAPMTTALARAGMSVMMSPQANSARTATRRGRVSGWVLSGGDAWRGRSPRGSRQRLARPVAEGGGQPGGLVGAAASRVRRHVPGHPRRRRGDRHRRHHRAVVAEDGGRERDQPRLELLVGHRVAAGADDGELCPQRRLAGDRLLGARLELAWRQLGGAVGKQHLAEPRGVQRDRAAHPVGAADEIGAVHLGDLVDAVPRGRDAQVDRLAGGLAESFEKRLRDRDERGPPAVAPGKADEHLTRQEPAVVIPADQVVALEREQQPGRRRLGQPGADGQLGERDRIGRVHNLRQQRRRPVHGLRAVGVAHPRLAYLAKPRYGTKFYDMAVAVNRCAGRWSTRGASSETLVPNTKVQCGGIGTLSVCSAGYRDRE